MNQMMETIPLISVVMPLYNKRSYVSRAVKSVQRQTCTDWELIIVDDGSTDGSSENLPLDGPRSRCYRQENRGPGAARNAGLDRARGKYVAFLDADDEWLPSFLEAGLSVLENKSTNATVVFTGFYYSQGMRRNTAGSEELSGVYEITADTDLELVQKILCFHWTCAAIMRTDVVRKWGGFFDRYKCLFGEDVYLFLKLIFNERIGIIPEPHAIYHTEASDLYGGATKKILFPTAPYLEDPTELFSSCPSEKLHLMKQELAWKALSTAEVLAKCGRGKESLELLNRFNQNGYPASREVRKVRFMAEIAPLLPAIGWVWRNTKFIRRIV